MSVMDQPGTRHGFSSGFIGWLAMSLLLPCLVVADTPPRETWDQLSGVELIQVGLDLINGEDGPKDPVQGRMALEMAAAKGEPTANYPLGRLYQEGIGVPVDLALAAQHYELAAEAGSVAAQATLGWVYYNGRGVQQDFVRSLHWYAQAAEQRLPQAEYALGLMYAQGQGTEKDLSQAVHWLERAVEHGSRDARNVLPRVRAMNADYASTLGNQYPLPPGY
jgi:TPR repeat protein